jgi:hypothetical protein
MNQNEKKNEDEASLVRQFKQELDDALVKYKPIMDSLIPQIHGITDDMNAAKRSGETELFHSLGVEKRAVGILWMHYYEAIQSKNRDYHLALRIQELQPTRIKQTVDERLEKAVEELRETYAKTIARFFDTKGHEAMYDTGTKPSRTS